MLAWQIKEVPTSLRTRAKRAPLTQAIKDAARKAAVAAAVAEVKRHATKPFTLSLASGIGLGFIVFAVLTRLGDD